MYLRIIVYRHEYIHELLPGKEDVRFLIYYKNMEEETRKYGPQSA